MGSHLPLLRLTLIIIGSIASDYWENTLSEFGLSDGEEHSSIHARERK